MVEQEFIKQIESLNQGNLGAFNQVELKKIIDEFSCFHSAYLMRAIALKQENEEKFQAYLPSIATRVLNRSVLYDRVTYNYNKTKEDIIKNINKLHNEATTLKTKNPEIKFQEDIKEPAEKVLNKDLEKIVKNFKKKPAKQTNVTKAKKISFSDWLKSKKSITPPRVKGDHKKNIEEIPLDMAASHEAALFIEAKKSSFKLEDFLVNQIERKQERKEKKTASFNYAVSETYAKILENQGKINEAINVYKELSIKYPKKSFKFASCIEKLKNSL